MAEISGFKGLRYNTEKAGDLNALVCPPYDIISPEQREKYTANNPYNIVRLELPAGGEERYKQAGAILNEWLNGDILKYDGEDGVYVYEMEFSAGGCHCERKRLKGFVCLVKLTEFSEGIVLPHEETLSKAKTDRFNLMSETNCNFSQIYSLYLDEDKTVNGLIENSSERAADMSVTDGDGTVHRLWKVAGANVLNGLTAAFADKKIYIADGHHRYETALNYRRHLRENGKATEGDSSGFVMMFLADMESGGLVVFPTHRIVKNLPDFDKDKAFDACGQYFSIEKTPDEESMLAKLDGLYKNGKTAFAFYAGGGECYILTLTDENAVKEILPDMSSAYCGLDVSVLHHLVLERIFGIDKENMANQKNLVYTRDLREALTAVDFGGADCAFILNPTKVSEIRDVALAGEKMPQKSTYFFPKLVTGLVINKFM